jgi:hypothetical protein
MYQLAAARDDTMASQVFVFPGGSHDREVKAAFSTCT